MVVFDVVSKTIIICSESCGDLRRVEKAVMQREIPHPASVKE